MFSANLFFNIVYKNIYHINARIWTHRQNLHGFGASISKELTQLGANNVQIGRRMVSFTGDKEMMYRAKFPVTHSYSYP